MNGIFVTLFIFFMCQMLPPVRFLLLFIIALFQTRVGHPKKSLSQLICSLFCSLCYFLKVFCTLEFDSVFCVASPISDFDGRSLWKDTSWSAGVAFITHRVFWEVEMAEASREEWFVWMGKDREGKVRGKDRRGARAKEGRKGGGLVGTRLRLEFSPQADKPAIPLFNIFISCLWRNWNIGQSPLVGFSFKALLWVSNKSQLI